MIDVLLLGLAVLAAAFFSGTESALFSLSRIRLAFLARETGAEAQAIVRTMRAPTPTLITLLVGNNFATLGGASFATALALRAFGENGVAIAVPAMTVLLLVFGEVLPKTIALKHPEAFARRAIGPFRVAAALAWPFRFVLVRATDALVALAGRGLGGGERARGAAADESHAAFLKAAVDVGFDEGILAPLEKEIFDNISEVHDLEVREVMTPRTEIFALPASTSVAEARRQVGDRRLSRVPAYEGRFENLVGLLHATDLLSDGDGAGPIRGLLRPLFYVPESKPVVDLLAEFRNRGVHFAVAIEESGGIAGIATLEDVLEEIVGEIRDERHVAHQRFVRRSPTSIIVSARMEIGTFNEVFDASIDSQHAETIGGFVLTRTGRIPRAGDVFYLDGLLFVVRRAEPQRLVELEVVKLPQDERSAS